MVRRQGTDLELVVRRYLWHQGLRFSVNTRDLPGSPDIVNRRRRWAVFIHGCFWHGHRGCGLARLPKTNQAFWSQKVRDNRRRDATKVKQLQALGFLVITVWGCEIKRLAKTNRSLVLSRFVRTVQALPSSG
jgi:DNA mismatch endonuclease (patch repair protein)